jgi:hypothetical protein
MAYDTAKFVLECREAKVTPHVAQDFTTTQGSRAGEAASLRVRKRIKEGVGWAKAVAGLAQGRPRRLARVDFAFVLSLAGWCGCRSAWRGPRHDRSDGLPADRPVADRRGRPL